MNRIRTMVGALLLALVAGTGAEAVSSPSGIDYRLRLEYDVVESKSGRLAIRGYVYNDHGQAATHVQLLVESVDSSGQVLGRAIGFVHGPVPGLNRSYFDVPVNTQGVSYRVTVTSFDWRDCE